MATRPVPLPVDPLIQTTGEGRWREQQSGTQSVVIPKGIEPSSRAWEAFVLPLNYTRMSRILREFPTVLKQWGMSSGGSKGGTAPSCARIIQTW
jgi:hypothetical protein